MIFLCPEKEEARCFLAVSTAAKFILIIIFAIKDLWNVRKLMESCAVEILQRGAISNGKSKSVTFFCARYVSETCIALGVDSLTRGYKFITQYRLILAKH